MLFNCLQQDADLIIVDGKKHVSVEIDIDESHTIVIVANANDLFGDINLKAIELLNDFYADEFKSHFAKQRSNWDVFNSLDNGIAYRGGIGYAYTIWKYNN
jgi:hypothetical protein